MQKSDKNKVLIEGADGVDFALVENQEIVGADPLICTICTGKDALPFQHDNVEWGMGCSVFTDCLPWSQRKADNPAKLIDIKRLGIGVFIAEFQIVK